MNGSLWWLLTATFLASLALTRACLPMLSRLGMRDLPGARRSHGQPVLRGGGIAIIVVCLLGWLWTGWRTNLGWPGILVLPLPVALLALSGWMDDLAPRSIRLRLGVQALAVALGMVLLVGWPTGLAPGAAWLLTWLGLMWLTNLYNFMDGSHGLATGQGVFSSACYAWLFWLAGDSFGLLASGVLAAACLGFLPFNFPRPRVFLGDAASAPLGLALGLLALRGVTVDHISPALLLLPLSLFLVDASATLADRVLRRELWYTAHREHAYQRLVSGGVGHTGTWLCYQAINWCLILPAMIITIRTSGSGWFTLAATLALIALGWLAVRRHWPVRD